MYFMINKTLYMHKVRSEPKYFLKIHGQEVIARKYQSCWTTHLSKLKIPDKMPPVSDGRLKNREDYLSCMPAHKRMLTIT